MQESLNVDILTNWVSMLRADVDGALWLLDDNVEGRFYEKIAHQSSRIVPAQGIALPLLDSVAERGVEGVVAAVRGVGTPADAPNIFRPGLADVTALLLMSSQGEQVILEVGGAPWLGACTKEIGSPLERSVRLSCAIAKVRAVCRHEGCEPLQPTHLHDVIAWDRFEISWDQIESLGIPGFDIEIRDECNGVGAQDLATILRECNGTDALHLLAAATTHYKPRGLHSYRQIDPATLTTMLRVAFRPSDLESDELFWKMKKWERTNPRYPLLKRWRDLDPLGVIWDQRYWAADLPAMLKTLEHGASLAVFKMDLDNFKAVNEKCGHTLGDEAIKLYCSTVQEVLGGVGEVYRRGGDEIIVLAPGLSEGSARELAEATRVLVESRFKKWGSEHGLESELTASIGLTLAAKEDHAAETIRLVDLAQKRAKDQGKNRVVVLSRETS